MRTVKEYENQLKELKTNSKPMINSLTMMAEDCIGQAELIVEVTEKQLRKVDPEFKLPILYLMDSIVQNVKGAYVAYFSKKIVNTFIETFEHVMKVKDKRRRELWKLRQTWKQVFEYNTLFYIDIRCHQLDPAWPVIAPPCAPAKIHVNPKILQKALKSAGSPATSPTLETPPTVVPTATSSPSLSPPGLSDMTATLPSDPDMDPSFKAQLLMKQKLLLELEAKKIQLELLAIQKQYELSKINHQLRPAEQASADTGRKQQDFVYDPEERKRSLDSLVSIDPAKKFRNQITQTPSMSTGDLSNRDFQQAAMNVKDQLEPRAFTRWDLVQRDRSGRKPWTGLDSWGHFGGGVDFAGASFGNPLPSPVARAPSPPKAPSVTRGQEHPRGQNPFEEIVAALVKNPPPILEHVIPPVDPLQWNKFQNDSDGTVLIDRVRCQMRFYGATAVVLQGYNRNEPREVSFHGGIPKNVFIDEELEPVRCFFGKPVMIYLDGQKHTLQLGSPTRELYIDGNHYEALYGGEPIRVKVGCYFHSFQLEGPPPEVELGKVPRYDLLAGRVNIFVDGDTFGVFLDDKPQLLDLFGFPVIIRFVDNFHKVLFNNRPFNVAFGGPPICLSTPFGRKHFLCFAAISANTRKAMLEFSKCREGGDGGDAYHYYRRGGPGRDRGGGPYSLFNPPSIEHHTVPSAALNPIPVEPREPEQVLEEEAEPAEPFPAQQVAAAQDTLKI